LFHHVLIILGRNGTLLRAEGAGSLLANLLQALRVNAAGGRHRIPDVGYHGGKRGIAANDVPNSLSPDVPGGAIADAIAGGKYGARSGPLAKSIVSESQPRHAVSFHFGNESFGPAAGRKQVRLGRPNVAVVLGQADRRGRRLVRPSHDLRDRSCQI